MTYVIISDWIYDIKYINGGFSSHIGSSFVNGINIQIEFLISKKVNSKIERKSKINVYIKI